MGIKKHIFLIQFFCLTSVLHAAVNDVEWYISNPAGMALERAMPLRALREKNALAVREIKPEDLPREIRKYYSEPWRITCSILYEDGKRVKTQWVFRDQMQIALFVAAISDNGSGFIEWYDDQGFLVEEQRLDADGSGYFISYSYKDHTLLKAEAHFVEAVSQEASDEETPALNDLTDLNDLAEELVPGIIIPSEDELSLIETDMTETPIIDNLSDIVSTPETVPSAAEMVRNPDGPAPIPETFVAITGRESGPVWTDFYRYTRSKGLRSIERVFHSPGTQPELIHFPRFVEGGPTDVNFMNVPAPRFSIFLSDIMNIESSKIDYTFDNKRRVITETYRGEDDAVIGELKNTWENDHLVSVTWTRPGGERRVAYIYDEAGEFIREENYNNGVMERSVTLDGDREIETLYRDNKEILRAVWLDGRKVSEERVGSSRR
ncbi:MAG: hypothetical protein LBK66_05045 [Spirochaetaceae bacterium]|nr:hypothetical protein [Spirochaetaceae bacterium]